MKEHKFPITKTARYFQLGELTEKTKSLWIVCHGYGQLAEHFLSKFSVLENEETCIVAPEGLHRYYLDGNAGRVGASWMTKEDRLTDIQDYVNYLDALLSNLTSTTSSKLKINVLGFSQGCATVSRWLNMGKTQFDHLLLYAGVFPPDMDWGLNPQKIVNTGTIIACGDDDEYIPITKLNELLNNYRASGIQFDYLPFKGKHQIYPEVLLKLKEHIDRKS